MDTQPRGLAARARSRSSIRTFLLTTVTVLVTVALVLSLRASPGAAEGLDFGCRPPEAEELPEAGEEVLDPDQLPQLLLGNITATVVASGTDAMGDPWVFGAELGEPVTTFEQDVPFTNVVTPIDFDADGVDDVGVSFVPRGVSHGTRIDALLAENFAATPDTVVTIDGVEVPTFGMTGVDTLITKLSGGVVDLMAGLRLEVAIQLPYDDGSYSNIAYRTDDLDAPADNEFPDATMFTFGVTNFGEGGFWPNDGYLLEAVEHSWDTNGTPAPESYRPAIRDEIDVSSVDDSDQVKPLFRATTGWSAAPLPFAAGLYSVCDPLQPQDSRTQISWNTAPTPTAATTQFDIDVVTGEGKGIDGHDEVVIDATLSALPARSDWTFRPEVIHVARSSEVTPALDLHELQLARGGDDDEPLVAKESRLDPLSEHSYLVVTYETVDDVRRLERIGVEFCPEDASALPAGEVVVPCTEGSPLAPNEARVDIRDFFDDTDVGDIPLDNPAGPESYIVYGSRDRAGCESCPSQFRIASRVNGARRVSVDLTHNSGLLQENRLDVDATLASPQPIDVVLHFDKLAYPEGEGDDDTPVAATGGAVTDADAAISEIPAGEFHLEQRRDNLQPFRLRTDLPGPAASLDGTFSVRRHSGDFLEVRGDVSAAPVPQTVTFDWYRTGTAGTSINRLSYAASEPTQVGLHGDITTASDREAETRLAIAGTVNVPGGPIGGGQGVRAEWIEKARADGELHLDEVKVSGCKVGVPCENGVDVVVARDFAYTPDEIAAVNLPEIPDQTFGDDGRHPEFTPWPAGEGIRAILRPRDVGWGVHASVRNVSEVRYGSDPQRYELLTEPTGEPFVVNVYDDRYATLDPGNEQDAALISEIGTASREIYVDGTILPLPKFIGVRYDEGIDDTATRVWVTTDPEHQGDLDDDNVPDNLQKEGYDEDPPGPEVMRVLLRIGDRDSLTKQWQGDWMHKTRSTGDVLGLDAQLWLRRRDDAVIVPAPPPATGENAVRTHRWALDLWANEQVPKGLIAEWGLEKSCDPYDDAWVYSACQSRRHFEPDQSDRFGAAIDTSSPDLGRLDAEVGFKDLVDERVTNPCSEAITGLQKPARILRGSVSVIPGDLDVDVAYASNRRLPWKAADLTIEASQGIPLVTLDVEEPQQPAYYRVAEAIEDDASYVRTDPYQLRLENVPSELGMHARLVKPDGPYVPDDTTLVAPEECVSPGGLAFVHAHLDLGNEATDVTIDAHQRGDERNVAQLRARDHDDNPVPISGDLRLRQDHIADTRAEDKEPPMEWAALVTWLLGPLGLAPIFEADIEFDADLDVDVPLRLVFTETADLRLGNNLTTFGVDLSDTPEAGAELQVRQTNMPDEPAVDRSGVFYHRQDVVLDGPFSQHRDEHRANAFADVGLYQWSECKENKPWKDEQICYWNHDATSLNTTDVTLHPNTSGSARSTPGLKVHDIMLDPFFQLRSREDMFNNWDKHEHWIFASRHVGSLFYQTLAGKTRPVFDADFLMPELVTQPTVDSDPIVAPAGADYCWGTGEDAIGSDGTRYEARRNCDFEKGDDGSHLVLAAYFAGEIDSIPRWRVHLPLPIGLDPNGNDECFDDDSCELHVTVEPELTGEVRVRVRTTRDGESPQEQNVGGYEAWYDASGNPGKPISESGASGGKYHEWNGSAAALPPPPETISGSTHFPTVLAPPSCPNPANWWCNAPEGGVRRSWFTGDGTRIEVLADGNEITHNYGEVETYRSLLVEYDEFGSVTRQRWFTMNITS